MPWNLGVPVPGASRESSRFPGRAGSLHHPPLENPVIKKKVIPNYPEAARKAHREGRVLLDGLIDTDGRILRLDVVFSPGDEFSQAATDAAAQWIYEPATLDGKPVLVFFTISVEFHLSS